MTFIDLIIYGNVVAQLVHIPWHFYKEWRDKRERARFTARTDLQCFLYKLKIRKWTYHVEDSEYGRTIVTPGPHFWARMKGDGKI